MMIPSKLKSRRCSLRPPSLDDLDGLLGCARDPDWGRYLPVPQPYVREQAEDWLFAQLDVDRRRRPIWTIELDGCYVGMANLILPPASPEVEIGISISPSHWGRGLAGEVLMTLATAAFAADPGLERIRAWTDRRNLRARRLLDHLGFELERVVLARRQVRGETVDDAGYYLHRDHEGVTAALGRG